MAYRRSGRPTYYFEARTETGRKQLSTGTRDIRLARRIETTWEEIASSHRAWDLLSEVLVGRLAIGALYDLWVNAKGNLNDVRRRLADVDLDPLVESWHTVYGQQVRPDSAAHALAHVRYFFPINERVLASTVDARWLSVRLGGYAGKRNTVRKVHSSLTGFLEYCTAIHGLFERNPMQQVPRPAAERTPIRYYEMDVVESIVEAQPTTERRALFALLYGTGIEVSVALDLLRSDINFADREIRARGTKAHSRDRVCGVAEWAWPIIEEQFKNHLPSAPLFPTSWTRWTVSDWHRQTVGDGIKDNHGNALQAGLKIKNRYPLHCARDHWAVRAARAGTPIAVIQAQLGHGSPMITLTKYARFQPRSADRTRWEQEATRYDERLKAAN